MASLDDLRDSISALLELPSIPAVLQLNNNLAERAFEVYILALLVKAIQAAGGTANLYGRNRGLNPGVAVFRGGHGPIGSDTQDFAYIQCILGTMEFELHLVVKYEGASGAIHEIDVSIYDHDAAETMRQSPTQFAHVRKLRGAIECKFYSSSLGTVLARTFVGLIDDCGKLPFKAFVTNGHSQGIASYLGHKQRPHGFYGLSPLNQDVETRFVRWFEQELRQWAKVG